MSMASIVGYRVLYMHLYIITECPGVEGRRCRLQTHPGDTGEGVVQEIGDRPPEGTNTGGDLFYGPGGCVLLIL